jgi:hypothetical protein
VLSQLGRSSNAVKNSFQTSLFSYPASLLGSYQLRERPQTNSTRGKCPTTTWPRPPSCIPSPESHGERGQTRPRCLRNKRCFESARTQWTALPVRMSDSNHQNSNNPTFEPLPADQEWQDLPRYTNRERLEGFLRNRFQNSSHKWEIKVVPFSA